MTRRVGSLAAGALWAGLGVLAILTVFGTILGLVMAWLVGVRRSQAAARAGACLGVLMLLPSGLVLDVLGCGDDACGPGPPLLAYGLPALVVVLNLLAAWPEAASGAARERVTAGTVTSAAGPSPDAGADLGAGI